MIGTLEALVLGIVQGATEYLPVSSSGHLVLAQHLFGLDEPVLFFDVVLHVGTLLAVVGFYRRDLLAIARDSLLGLVELGRGRRPAEVLHDRPGLRFGLLVAAGSVPTAIIGLAFKNQFERLFGSVTTVGAMLLVTAALLATTRLAPEGHREIAELGFGRAVAIGLVQGLAITPGISRSGATISLALLLGVDRTTAARFSFVLSVPSILGALVLESLDATMTVPALPLALGFASAAVTGLLCLVLLVHLVKRGRLSWFAPYCAAIGILALALG